MTAGASSHLRLPRLFSRYDTGLGLAVATSDPDADSSTADVIRDALTFHLNFEYGSQITTAIAIVAMVVGLTLVFLGVRLCRPLLFAFSWLFLGGCVFLISMLASHHDSTVSFIVGVSVGLVLAAIVVKVYKLALFVVVGLVGVVLWVLFETLFPSVLSTPVAKYVVLGIATLLCGLLGVWLEKTALLVATPVIGSFLFLQGLDHFIHQNLNAFVLMTSEGQRQCEGRAACFGLYAALVTLAVIGIFVQWRYTSECGRGSSRPASSVDRKALASEMIILSSPKKAPAKTFKPASPTRSVASASSSSSYGRSACSPTYSSSFTSPSARGGSPSDLNPFTTRRSVYGGEFGYAGNPFVEAEYFEGTA